MELSKVEGRRNWGRIKANLETSTKQHLGKCGVESFEEEQDLALNRAEWKKKRKHSVMIYGRTVTLVCLRNE